MAIPVDQVRTVTAARCTLCLDCIEACPQRDQGAIHFGPFKAIDRKWSQALLVIIMLALTTAAVAASYAFPLASFVATRGDLPEQTAAVEFEIDGVRCQGTSTSLFSTMERKDQYRLKGYLKLETWPNPNLARVRVTYDPTLCNEDAVKKAITEILYDSDTDDWELPPFTIDGYDPLGLNSF